MKTNDFIKNELPLIAKDLKELNGHPLDRKQKWQLTFSELKLDELLRHVICEQVFYFKSKYEDFTFLGIGCSQTIKGHELQDFLTQYPDLYLVPSFSFEDDPKKADLTLHEWIFISQSGKTQLFILPKNETQLFSRSELLFDPLVPCFDFEAQHPSWITYEESPERDHWTKMIEASDHLFNEQILEKIVLSRKKIFTYSCPLDSMSFFSELVKKNLNNPAYHIFKQDRFGEAFLCIGPERLFSIKDNTFESISLAASAPRGLTPQEDLELEHLLQTDEKLAREHNLVTDEIVRRLSLLTYNIHVSPLVTMKLPYIQHRSATIKAQLNSQYNLIDLIDLLHPTPAVGGLPSILAKEKISELEGIKRKFYAAPIGILSAHFSELAVGIRSGMIEKEKLTLYGGAGIIKGSDASAEWNETGAKMNPFLKVVYNE